MPLPSGEFSCWYGFMEQLEERLRSAQDICRVAGAEALRFFSRSGSLAVDQKGTQDWVSEADVFVERVVRERLASDWPDDGIFGEEFEPKAGTSGFNWVIDPIDGTTNFINGIPAWTADRFKRSRSSKVGGHETMISERAANSAAS